MLKNSYTRKIIETLSIVDRVSFLCDEVIEKVILKYLDGYGNENTQEFTVNQTQNLITVSFAKTLVKELSIEVLGVLEIRNIEINTHPIENFSINEDVEKKIPYDSLAVTSSAFEASKPISRAFDGNLNSEAQLKKYSNYGWIHMVLSEEKLIDCARVLSYRSSTSGLIKKFKILVKNPMDESWVEAGTYTIEEFKNEWMTIKTTPYLTKEITLIVEDSENKWAYINEIEIYNYSTFERDILNLFTDESLMDIKSEVTYWDIVSLKERVISTEHYKELLNKALEIYLSKKTPATLRMTFENLKVIDNLRFRASGEMELYTIEYVNSANERIKISTPILEEGEIKLLNIPKIFTKEICIEIFGVNSIEDIGYEEYPVENFSLIEDNERRISKESIDITTLNENSKFPLTNMLDGNEKSESHMSGTYSGYHDYTFKIDNFKIIDKFKILSTRFNPSFTSGSIKRFEIFNRDLSSEELVSLGSYTVEEFNDEWRELNFAPALTDEIILRVYESDRNWICINEVEIYQYSLLEKAIKELFSDDNLTTLKENVTYWKIQELRKIAINTKEYIDLLNKAEELFYSNKTPVTLELNFETLKVIDNIQFKVDGIVEKNYIGYLNTQNENIKLIIPLVQNGENIIIDTSKFLTKNLYIQLYGITEIRELTYNEYPFENFAIVEDRERKLLKENITITTLNENLSFPLTNMLDGNEKSESHISGTYSGHHDFNFKLDSLRIIDEFKILSTRFNPNFTSGSVKRFEVLGKDSSSCRMISLGNYTVEEYSDEWHELKFAPALTDEIILRVYESDKNWVCINEVEIFNYSTLGAQIYYLFADQLQTALRSDVTFEEIKRLADMIITNQEYRDLINKAFELYYEGVPPKCIEIEFGELKIFSEIEFDIDGRLEKVILNYYDTYNNLQVKDCSINILENKGTISLGGFAYTRGIKLDVYGARDLANIKFKEHQISEFALAEDLEQRIAYEQLIVSCDNGHESYPLSNMFDGNERTDFRSKAFTTSIDINIKLNEPTIIDKVGITSFRFDSPNGVTGLIKKASILIKDTVSKKWLEFGYLEIEEFVREMHILKNSPYLTDEMCIRILEADRSWALINELAINKYSLLEAEIKNLFTDETYAALKESVNYELIRSLKERATNSEDLKKLLAIALELYFKSKTPILDAVPVDKNVVFDRVDLEVIGKIERIVFEYEDNLGSIIQKTFDYLDQENDNFSLNLPKIHGENVLVKVYGVDSILSINANTYSVKEFSIYNDIEICVPTNEITVTESNPTSNSYLIERAFDGNMNTEYRSKGFKEYSDITIKLKKETLIESINLYSFRSANPGIVKGYSIFIKNMLTDEWKEFGKYLNEEFINNWSTVKNNAYLTDEIKIRVTDAESDWACINEIQICPINTLRYDVDKLFKNNSFMELRDGVTLEEILTLEGLIKKDSALIKKTQLAKFLFESVELEEFDIPLKEIKIFDRVEFITEGQISKIHLKYKDTFGFEREKEVPFEIEGDNVSINFEKIMTNKASIIIYGKSQIYGIQKIYQIKTNSYNLEEFAIDEDIDTRLQRESFSIRHSALSGGYNDIEKLFDGDLVGQVHFKKTPGAYIYLKLNKPMLIEAGRVMSYRNGTSGFLQKYKVSLKNSFDESWVDLGSFERGEYLNDWLEIKGQKYLTDEVWFDFEQGENNWALINEVEVFAYNILEEKINNLFKTSECLELKDSVTIDDINNLLAKDLFKQEYIDKLILAKQIYIEKIFQPIEFHVKNSEFLVANGLEIKFEELSDKILDISVYYKDSLGNKKVIKDLNLTADLENQKLIGYFSEKVLMDPKIQLILDEDEKWKVKSGEFNIINQKEFYNNEDVSNIYSNDLITLETSCVEKNGLENILDGNSETYYQNLELGDIVFKFQNKKIFNSLTLLSEVVGQNTGKIYSASIFYRSENQNSWEKLANYENTSPISSMHIEFTPTLAKEIRVIFQRTVDSQIVVNKVEFNVYNKFDETVEKIFKDKEMFTKLNSNITKDLVERLKSRISSSTSIISTKLKIAENILNNNNELEYDIFTLKALEHDTNYYFTKLQTGTTGRTYPTPYYVYPNTDHVFISNKDLRLELSLADHKPLSEQTFYIKKGINIVNLGDKTGHVFINGGSNGGREEEIKLYTTDEVTGLHYKYGFTTEEEFYSKERNLTYKEDNHVSSNTAYIEGKNFTSAIRYDWIRDNIPYGTLTNRVKALDEFLDFLYYIAEAGTYFENAVPYKRLMWEGGTANPHAGGCYAGAYTAYSNNPLAILNKDLSSFASGWVVGHEVGHEMDSNSYLMGIFGEVMNNWFAEEGRIKYLKNPRCAPNLVNIMDTEVSIYDMGFFDRLAFWIKLRLYYNDGDFFVKYHNIMRHLPTELEIFSVPDRLMIMASMIIGRDTSDYFLRHKFPITESAVEISSKYPKFTIDITKINWDNQEEFREEEKNRIYQIYKEKV
ncbi:discoidin domain-containing protein [Cetobacterium sp.]|uniref:discoidin domain-containing protein n=1 Tax=Cetobacterium sp. TaxID=2071632 RepID=UPI003F2DA1A7